MAMNKWCGLGRLVRDPETKITDAGLSITKFTLAIDRGYVKQGEERQADFIPIISFGKSAEFAAKYYVKGLLVAVVGRIQTRSWDDIDGKKHYATEIVAEELHFAESKKGGNGGQAQQNTYTPQQSPDGFNPADVAEDDLPF